jgi:hypothetical protein
MKIIREPLADKGRRSIHAGYDRINWETACSFAQMAAQAEADSRDDCKSISRTVRDHGDGRHTPEFTLMGHRSESLAKFYAVPR